MILIQSLYYTRRVRLIEFLAETRTGPAELNGPVAAAVAHDVRAPTVSKPEWGCLNNNIAPKVLLSENSRNNRTACTARAHTRPHRRPPSFRIGAKTPYRPETDSNRVPVLIGLIDARPLTPRTV